MIVGPVTDCTLLLIDDEEANLDLLEAFLESDGYHSLVRVSDARQAVPAFEACAPDLVLLDLHMPHHSGFEILREIRERTPPGGYLPVLVLTADVTPEAKERALSGGARDFLTKPLDVVEVLLRVRNLLETRVLHSLQREGREKAEAAARRSALLAEASQVLGASLDYATSLVQLAQLLVPRLGDACALLLRENEQDAPAGVADADPARESALRDALTEPATAALLTSALQGEGAQLLPQPAGDGAFGAEGPGVTLVAPLRIREGAIGALVLVRRGEGRSFDPDDVALAEEIASRAALAVENARLFAEAQWATRARERMLSVVAHDLRNPLAVVTMYAEMMLSMLPPGGDAYQRDALNSIFQSTERMQHLIEDLLDASRLQQGTFSLDREEQPVGMLFSEAERMLRPLAEARSIQMVFRGEGTSPAQPVLVDGARFLQVVSNLVGNAVKFTPEGGQITVSWTDAGDDHLRVSVADTGPGISAEQLPHVFGAFWQAREADRRGVGLGLWISRAIVEAHGGRIWIDSREGEGATFHFALPWGTARVESEPPLAVAVG